MRRSKKIVVVAFALAAFVILSASKLSVSTGYKVGDKAEDFKLKNVDGKMVTLADFKDAKGFIVTFTCNHCPFSKAYEDRIISLHNKYSVKGYPVIAINPNDKEIVPEDSYENMQERAKEKKFPFAYLYDETQNISMKFGASRTPHVFIIKKEKAGMMVKYIGAIDDNADDETAVKAKYVENAMDELLAGKEVAQNFTRAVGCSIKWKK